MFWFSAAAVRTRCSTKHSSSRSSRAVGWYFPPSQPRTFLSMDARLRDGSSAHRLSTIKNCDRIIVLDEGKIAEDGTYDELIKKNGIFAELVSRQQVERKNVTPPVRQ